MWVRSYSRDRQIRHRHRHPTAISAYHLREESMWLTHHRPPAADGTRERQSMFSPGCDLPWAGGGGAVRTALPQWNPRGQGVLIRPSTVTQTRGIGGEKAVRLNSLSQDTHGLKLETDHKKSYFCITKKSQYLELHCIIRLNWHILLKVSSS